MPDIVITPNRGTSNNPKIDFTGTSAGTIKLEVLADGSIAWNGANGSLFSIADSLSGSLMSVNDISGLPAFEVFSDNRVIVGQFGANLLLGKTTSSSNGRLQLATHTTVAGGIGFGTDIGLYRLASNKLSFRGTADAEMSLRFERTGGSFTTTWENYIPVGSTDLKWFNGADKFTLTASGNATFSGYVVSTSGFATSGIYNYAFLQTTDSNNFWITPGNNQWGLYFETSAGGLLGGTGDSNRLGFVGNATARFYVDLNNGNGWFGGTATATQLISNVAQGTAPLVVTSTTQVSNLNAQYLNGYSSDTANTANTIVRRDGSGNFSAGTITATLAGLATSETLSTVTGRGATTASQISVNTSAGGSMLTGTKAGGTYGDGVSGATFKSILDNANGGAAFAFSSYYGGSGGTLGASIRADGYAYFKEDVGIGTNSPSGKLDVRVAGTGTWDRFIVTTTTSWGDGSTQYVTIGAGGAAGIMLSNPHVVWNSGNSAAGIRMGRSGGISSGAWYEVGTGTSDSFHIKKEGTTRLYIDTNGNVGIGTTSPSYKLHVEGDSYSSTGFYVRNSAATFIGSVNNMSGMSVNGTSYDTLIYSGGNQTITVKSGGNVGIGTTSPGYKLQVQGTAYVDSTLFVNGATTIEDTLTVKTQSGSHNVAIIDYSGVAGGRIKVLVDGVVRSQIGSYSGDNTFFNAGYGGNVGIGTSTPSYLLHAVGDIYADGGWFRVSGNQGYYFETHGGGWYMSDSTWLRAYNDKAIVTNNEVRATIFKDANDTAYYADPASTSVLSKLSVGNAPYVASIQAGALELGRTDTNYQYISGWTGTMQGGILANCADNWEFVIHDSGHRLASAFEFRGSGTNVIRLGRDLGWGVTPIETPGNLTVIGNAYAPVFYDYNDTNFRLDPASTTTSLQIAGAIEQGNNFAHPNVEWAQSGSATGMVIIKFPGNTGNYGMIHAVVDIYEYSSNSACTVTVAGHNWNGAWYNISSEVIGYTDKQVRVGVKDSQYCIVIGTSGSSWSYGQVRLRKIQNGSYYNDQMDLGGTYSASITTTESFSNISGDLRNLRTPNNINVGGAIYGQVFYDSNNTSYYVDPNNNANIAGQIYVGGWFRNYGNQGLYNESYGNHWYATGNDYWNLAGNNASNIGIILRSGGHQGTIRGYVYADSNNHIGFLNNGGAWRLRVVDGDYTLADGSSIRGQLFYDSNNTSYYCDPASTSRFSTVDFGTSGYYIGAGDWGMRHTTPYGWIQFGPANATWAHIYASQSIYFNVNTYVNGNWMLYENTWQNGKYFETSGVIYSQASMRAPIFYDYNDTNYYVDPASTSRVNTISFVSGASFGPYLQFNNQSNLRLQAGQQSGAIGISGYDFNGNWKFQLYGDSSGYGFLNGNWAGWDLLKSVSGNLYLNNQSTYYIGTSEIYYNRVYGLADIRSPIFYDNNDTGYYVDPAGTSYLYEPRMAWRSIVGEQNYDATLFDGGTSYRPGIVIRGNYPHIDLVSSNINNSNHGPTLRFVAYDTASATSGNFKHWVMGCAGTNATRFSIGYDANQSNPHYGIYGAGTSAIWIENDYNVYFQSSIRPTIIYDRNNTSYYVDPNSTSNLNVVKAGYFCGNDGNAYGQYKGYDNNNHFITIRGAVSGTTSSLTITGAHQTTFVEYAEVNDSTGWFFKTAGTGNYDIVSRITRNYSSFEGSARAPLFYDSNDTNYYVDPANGGFVLRGGTSNRVTFSTTDSGIFVANAEGGGTTVRLGAAWGCPGVYNNTSLTLGAESNIEFRIASAQKGYIDSSSNLIALGSMRSPYFYDYNDTNYYLKPNGTSYLWRPSAATQQRWGISWRAVDAGAQRTGQSSDPDYWTTTIGWGTGYGTWADYWKYGAGAFDCWGYSTDHPQGSGYIHAQGIQSGLHYANSNGTTAYGWQMVGAADAGSRWWLRGKWGGTTYSWYEIALFNRNVGGIFYADLFYDAGNTGYYVDPASTSVLNNTQINYNQGNFECASNNNSSTSYSVAAIELRETSFGSTSGYLAPRLGFHWGGVVASQIGIEASGRIKIIDNPGTSYEAFIAAIVYGDASVRGPLFYDSNNTAYYFDGASTSVANNVQITTLGVGTAASGTGGEIRATNNITAYYSDERLKTRLGKIEDPIAKVKSLSGFYFEANETAVALGYDKKREVGVSAQEVQAVLPEIIAPAPISDKYMTVRYEKLIPLLIEAIKEQQTQIEQLSNELKSLKNKL